VFGYQNRLWATERLDYCRTVQAPAAGRDGSPARRSDVVELGRLDQSWLYLDSRDPLTRVPAGIFARFGERALVRKRAHPATYPRFGRAARSHSHTQPHARRGQTRKLALLSNTGPPPPAATHPNTFVEITHVTLTPQELIPGTSCSSVAFMTWHVEMPMMATIWPGSTARAAARTRGHRRCRQPLQCLRAARSMRRPAPTGVDGTIAEVAHWTSDEPTPGACHEKSWASVGAHRAEWRARARRGFSHEI
jgi:hypothetical protein